MPLYCRFFFFFSSFSFFHALVLFQLLNMPWWSQVSSLLPPRFVPSIFIAHRAQRSHSSSAFHRVLLTHAPALCARQLVHKKKSLRIYTSMHSGGLELTKLTNLIRHRGDRHRYLRLLIAPVEATGTNARICVLGLHSHFRL